MRIVYIAKHGQVNSNDDEGAIAYALTQLGHEVVCVHEQRYDLITRPLNCDLVLFHHWRDAHLLQGIDHCVKAFWCFDLISWPDPTLAARCEQRKAWIRQATEVCDIGFCTDGDWVAQDTTGKLRWLSQGADERVMGPGFVNCCGSQDIDILFTGITRGGQGRESFVREMRERWGSRFHHVERGVHGRALADLIARSKIVVAPDSPVTDRYWSNRVYNVLGFGGFLLHPYSEGLEEQYGKGILCWYSSREQLHQKIRVRLGEPATRLMFANEGIKATASNHTYRHRCAELITEVEKLV